eukprot:CFRG1545T1
MMASDLEEWKNRWETGSTGWRQEDVNESLLKYKELFTSQSDAKPTVFVPLCGSSTDLSYLAKEGMKVVGVEISEMAIETFFTNHDLKYTKADNVYTCDSLDITIYVEDLFTFEKVKNFDFIWDYASFVAIDMELRPIYMDAVGRLLSPNGAWLLVNFDFSLEEVKGRAGPPWPITKDGFNSLVRESGVGLSVEKFNGFEKLIQKFKDLGSTYFFINEWVLRRRD